MCVQDYLRVAEGSIDCAALQASEEESAGRTDAVARSATRAFRQKI